MLRKLQFVLLFQLISSFAYGLNIAIVVSGSNGLNMDARWDSVARKMGHTTRFISQQSLENKAYFTGTDILIVSAGTMYLSAASVSTITDFLKTGRPVYLQSEYMPSYSTNVGFATIVKALGGSFQWQNDFAGDLHPMNILGAFSTTKNKVASLSYFWYSVSGKGDCNTVNFLEYGDEYHGFQYIPGNISYGNIVTTTDQDWVRENTSPELMENIITNLISPLKGIGGLTFTIGEDTTLCAGETLTLNATTPGATYLWQDNSTKPTLTVTKPGKYWVKVSTANCASTDTITINYINLPTVFLGNDTNVCEGDILTLDATTPNATYLWQDNSTNAKLSAYKAGKYWVIVKINNCIASDTITIKYTSFQNINLGNDAFICNGEVLTLNAASPNSTYLWQDNSTDEKYIVTMPGKYWVKVKTEKCSSSDTILVNYLYPPKIDLGKDTNLCLGESVTLNAITANAVYLWQDNSTEANFKVIQSGKYWVKVKNQCGDASDTISISIDECTCPIYIPNAFTPNEDALNDKFKPVCACRFEEYRFMIFNRWGEKVFDTTDYNASWNGVFKGKKSQDGVYKYVLIYKFNFKQNMIKNGSFNLLH